MKSRRKSTLLLFILFLLTFSPLILLFAQKAFALRVACVGDSITYGSKLEDRFLNSYPAQLQQMLGGSYLVKNFGAPGYTLQKEGNFPYWNHPCFQESSEFQPDYVLLMLGTNDTKPYNWAGEEVFLEDYKVLIEHYRGLESRPKIILMTPASVFPESFQPSDHYKIQGEIADRIASAVRELGQEEGLPVLDVNAATKNRPEYFLTDGIHPDSAGAKAIARLVFQFFQELEP